ncbi:hypothetical protein [Paenibacillus glucanolyticus]|uniref:hypothetical protein n=1 Tax=Paenibacillus glucanolyticus TaxID=59843 RepID=UPI0034D0093A
MMMKFRARGLKGRVKEFTAYIVSNADFDEKVWLVENSFALDGSYLAQWKHISPRLLKSPGFENAMDKEILFLKEAGYIIRESHEHNLMTLVDHCIDDFLKAEDPPIWISNI